MYLREFPRRGKVRVPTHEYNSAFLTLWFPQRFANVKALPPIQVSAKSFSCGKVLGFLPKSTQDHAWNDTKRTKPKKKRRGRDLCAEFLLHCADMQVSRSLCDVKEAHYTSTLYITTKTNFLKTF